MSKQSFAFRFLCMEKSLCSRHILLLNNSWYSIPLPSKECLSTIEFLIQKKNGNTIFDLRLDNSITPLNQIFRFYPDKKNKIAFSPDFFLILFFKFMSKISDSSNYYSFVCLFIVPRIAIYFQSRKKSKFTVVRCLS